jgi:LysM repeat protein
MKRMLFSVLISLAMLAMTVPVYADTLYVVKPGDALSRIAIQFGVSVQAIVTANGLNNANVIQVGQTLIIPTAGTVPSAPAAAQAPTGGAMAPSTYWVQSGDTLYKISRLKGVSLAALMAANQLKSYIIFAGQALIIPGTVTAAPAPVSVTPAPAAAASAAPAPAATTAGVYTAGPLRTDYFYMSNMTIAVGMSVWFNFKVTNVVGGDGKFGILSVFSNINLHGNSWTNSSLKLNESLEWRDHINISTPGVYPFYLAVCFAEKSDCDTEAGLWQRLSDTVWVTVQDPTGSTGYASSRGVVGNYFYVENPASRVGDPVWFDFKVTNTGGDDVYYGVLSAQAKGVQRGKSWTSNRLTGGQIMEWRDHFYNLPAGTFAVFLGICYSGQDYCLNDGTLWEPLSGEIIITVKDPNQ